jgi:beta-mannosidase
MPSALRSRRVLTDGWHAVTSEIDPLPLRVPGTAAGALRDAGLWSPRDPRDLDAEEWSFTTRFDAAPAEADEEVVLHFDGIATVFDVFLNGETILSGTSMFRPESVDVGLLLAGDNELTIRCLPLRERLAQPHAQRARWRTRVVEDGSLRFFRTALLGRAPGFAPGPAPVGPWRQVTLERRRRFAVDELAVRTRLDTGDGTVSVRLRVRGIGGVGPRHVDVVLDGPSASHRGALHIEDGDAAGTLRIAGPKTWWPHTHGEPTLYSVRVLLDGVELDAGRVGFRTLESSGDLENDGLDLHVNGVPIFARGAIWTPPDLVGFSAEASETRATIARARDAGMNLLRVPGTAVYEDDAFYDACDELGVLVWQDFMFANLDYPVSDPSFRVLVEEEARAVLARVAGRPSLAVVCGNSEVEQQAAMLGLDPKLGRGELFGGVLPRLVGEAETDAVYVPSAPTGGDLPFRSRRGVANYYGVGAYRRPLEDARRAEVRFAAECLALANVPDDEALAATSPADPQWKVGVPRDAGADWDFEDVRDHYLRVVFDVDPVALRESEPERYLELSRAVSGEVMAETLGEWRRRGSPTRGALVLWLRDVLPGTGWGLLDHRGEPKVAWHHVRRVLAPVAVWTTDEGLNGVDVHVANDRPYPLRAELRVALYRSSELRVDEVVAPIELRAHGSSTSNVEELLGRFVDASWAYRFGPPGHDAIVASLERGGALLSQALRFPAGRPLRRETADDLQLQATIEVVGDRWVLAIRSRRLAYGVRVKAPGLSPSDDAFCVEPGRARQIDLIPVRTEAPPGSVVITALNLDGRLHVPLPPT